MNYKIIVGDKEYPATVETLAKWIAEKRVNRSTKAMAEDATEWTTLGATELASLFPAEKRYFHRIGNSKHDQFTTYGSAGGVLMGVFATADQKAIEEIFKETKEKRSGITEIDYAEYVKCAKKLAAEAVAAGSGEAVRVKFPAGTKFFHVLNANQYVVTDGKQFQFEVYEQNGGVWMGVLATAKPEEIAALENLAASRKTSVSAMTEAEYVNSLKKKVKGQSPFIQSLLQRELREPGKTATTAVNSEPESPLPPEASIPQGAKDALDVGKVNQPQP